LAVHEASCGPWAAQANVNTRMPVPPRKKLVKNIRGIV
jgi:hypothetical protein